MDMKKERQLLFSVTLADCRVETFRAGGKGGQHQNKTESGVRIRHLASGAVGECREHRSQHQNKKIAFLRMIQSEKFRKWHRLECARRLGRLAEIEREVERMMRPENLRVEVRVNGRWVDESAAGAGTIAESNAEKELAREEAPER
jgi:protein subunit release factor B